MQEINKKTLIEALSTLPEYEPPAEIWEAIQMQAEEFPPELMLKEMPAHEPPAKVWEGILTRLETPEKRVVAISVRWKKVLAVAASLALLLFVVWQMKSPASQAVEEGLITFSTETVDDVLLKNDWDEDEEAFAQFELLCESKKVVCEQPEFEQLKTELSELTDAKEALKEAMGSYGGNAELISQIKEIELERTGILKKMMVMLI